MHHVNYGDSLPHKITEVSGNYFETVRQPLERGASGRLIGKRSVLTVHGPWQQMTKQLANSPTVYFPVSGHFEP
jgi:hypothetical protein